ncbi:MAG: COG1361 S-layer family protein [Nitrososphaerota archaeon]
MKLKSRHLLMILLIASMIVMQSPALDTVRASKGIEILDYYWGRAGEEWAVIPGDDNAKLTLIIKNNDDTTICGLKATIFEKDKNIPYPFRDKDGRTTILGYHEGYIRVGEVRSIEFDVSVIPEAKPGYYDVNVYFTYMDCEDPDYPELSTRASIKLKVWDYPEIKVIDSNWVTQDGLPTYAGPGDYAKFLTLTLYLPRYYSASNIKGILYLSRSFTNLTGGRIAESFYTGQVLGGQVFSLKFGLNIAEDALIGVHTLSLSLRYYNRWLKEVSQEIQVPVKVSGSGDLDVNLQGMLISAGSLENAEIVIKNKGSAPIYSVKSRVTAEGGLIILSEITKEVNILTPGQSVTFKPLIFAPPTLPEGSYALTLTINYLDSSGIQKSEVRGIGVYVRRTPEVGLTSFVEGEPLITSRSSKINIVLKNLYDGPVTEVKTLISLKGLPAVIIAGEQNAYIHEMKPGEEVRIPLELLVSPKADETVYEGSITISYRDPYGQPRTDSLSLPLIVKGLIKLSFRQLQLGVSKTYPGGLVDILGEVLNSGTTTARLTNVKLILEEPLTPTQYSTYYIGDVSPYSTSSFTLSLRVSDNAKPGTYNVKVVVEAENSYGDKIEASGYLDINVGEKPPESTSSPKPSEQSFALANQQVLLVVLAMVALGVITYVALRRRKKKVEIT